MSRSGSEHVSPERISKPAEQRQSGAFDSSNPLKSRPHSAGFMLSDTYCVTEIDMHTHRQSAQGNSDILFTQILMADV
ncbi:hypothetical protein ElyMa_005815700, partial [Elysia marginata]